METMQAYDLGTLYFFNSIHHPWLDPVVIRLTLLGEFPLILLVVVAAVGLFLILRRPRLAGILVIVSLTAWGVEWSAKWFVQRPRPDVAWRLISIPSEPSFPSGHSLCSMAIYGCIGFLAARMVVGRWRGVVIASGIAMGLLIGMTRPYLGVHYPLDVLGGWTAGLAFALFGAALAEPRQVPAELPDPPLPASVAN